MYVAMQCVKNEKWRKIRDHRGPVLHIFFDLELASSHSSLSPRAVQSITVLASIRILFLFLALFITGDGSPRDMLDLVTQ